MENHILVGAFQEGARFYQPQRPEAHDFLTRHLTPDQLSGRNVVVPNCGRSVDMIYLAQHAARVTGTGCTPMQIEQFQEENCLYMEFDGAAWRFDSLSLSPVPLCNLPDAQLGTVDIVYDRSAMISTAPDMRGDYLSRIDRLTRPGGRIYLMTVEFSTQRSEGPYSISAAEVETLFGDRYTVKHLEEAHCPAHLLARAHNLADLREHFFCLTRKPRA